MYSSVYTKRISRRRNLAYQMIRCFSSHYTTNVSDIKFAYKFYPAKDPNIKRTTIFLHGLYGYKEEWNLVASDEQILNLTNCYIFDAVNHGDTSHFPHMSFEDQAEHVIQFANIHKIDKFSVVGHSMGGRAGMKTAILNPSRIQAVMSLDAPAVDLRIFPGYLDRTSSLVSYLAQMDLNGKTYSMVRTTFMNLFKNDEESVNRIMLNFRLISADSELVEFRCNPKNIVDNLTKMFAFQHNGKFNGPAKMLIGGISNRFKYEHFKECFPNLKEEDIITKLYL